MNDTTRWWWPHPDGYWPAEVARELTLDTYISAFAIVGFVPCYDSSYLEPGYEKIALFIDASGKPTHAARQLSSGVWTSKLGPFVDIEHELSALEGQEYGSVAVILRRPAVRTNAAIRLVFSIYDWVRKTFRLDQAHNLSLHQALKA